MSEHLPECWTNHESDPPAWCICDELRACEKRIIAEAKRIIAGFLGMDDTGERRCSFPACDLCIVAPLIYAALEDLILSKGDQP
jgi:hypothetical protein